MAQICVAKSVFSLGTEGYGIYFMLLETLREQQDLMYPLEDLDLLAEEFNVSEAKVRVAICNYGLFEIDEEQKFFSPKMLVYLEPYFKMKEQRKVAGQRSADKRKSIDVIKKCQRHYNVYTLTNTFCNVTKSRIYIIGLNQEESIV